MYNNITWHNIAVGLLGQEASDACLRPIELQNISPTSLNYSAYEVYFWHTHIVLTHIDRSGM